MATVAAVYTIQDWPRRPEQIVGELAPEPRAVEPRPRPEDKRVWASLLQPPEEIIAQAFEEAERARYEATAAREASAKAADEAMAAFRASYPTQLRFAYRFRAQEKPFNVSAIYHDGQFTYIHAQTAELPSLYELRDDAPNLVPFQVEHGIYIVPKVVERGYLAIGKQRFFFAQTAR